MPILPRADIAPPEPNLECLLRRVTSVGILLVLALPIARGDSIWFGALPLWLVGMPLSSWWALHRFRLPRFASPSMPAIRPRRRVAAQARRRPGARSRRRVARAA